MKRIFVFFMLLVINTYAMDEAAYQKSCLNDHNGTACAILGGMYHRGEQPVERNLVQAVKYYKLACSSGVARPCGILAILLESDKSKGIKKDIKATIAYATRGCELEDGLSCSLLAQYYKEGKLLAKDSGKAAFYDHKACKHGYTLSCKDESSLKAMYVMGCYKMKDGDSCLALAQDLNKKKNADIKEVFSLVKRGCDLGSGRSCALLSIMYWQGMGTKQNYDKAFEFSQLSCDMKEASGCFMLGTLYEKGIGREVDFPKAAKLYKIACDNGNTKGCLSLAPMYSNGRGVLLDIDMSINLIKKACQMGDQVGCSIYKELVEKGVVTK